MEREEFLYNIENRCPSLIWEDGASMGDSKCVLMSSIMEEYQPGSCMACWQNALKEHNETIEDVDSGACPVCDAIRPVDAQTCTNCGFKFTMEDKADE